MVLVRSQTLADRYIVKALQQLDTLPKNESVNDLMEIARFIGQRKY